MQITWWNIDTLWWDCLHYTDVIMGAIVSQITRLVIVYLIVYSDADQRKHQSSAPLAFVRGIHRGPMNSPHKWPVTRKKFPFDDVIISILTIRILVKTTQTTFVCARMTVTTRGKLLLKVVCHHCNTRLRVDLSWMANAMLGFTWTIQITISSAYNSTIIVVICLNTLKWNNTILVYICIYILFINVCMFVRTMLLNSTHHVYLLIPGTFQLSLVFCTYNC